MLMLAGTSTTCSCALKLKTECRLSAKCCSHILCPCVPAAPDWTALLQMAGACSFACEGMAVIEPCWVRQQNTVKMYLQVVGSKRRCTADLTSQPLL